MSNMTNMVTSRRHGAPQFIERYVKVDPLGIIPKQELYDKYVVYCRANGYILHPKGSFSKALYKLINASSTRRTINGSRTWCWAGITLKETEDYGKCDVLDTLILGADSNGKQTKG